MARKGNPISVTLGLNRRWLYSFVLLMTFIVFFFSLFFLMGFDLNLIFLKMESLILGKGLSLLFHRIGFHFGFLALLFSAVAGIMDFPLANMMAPAGDSGDPGSIIYRAPSPGGPVEILEIPESPSNPSPGPSQPVPPLPAPSGPSSSSSWTEDSFELQVLLEPFSETEMQGTAVNSSIPRVARDEAGPSYQAAIVHNSSLESSIRSRIRFLEEDSTIFLLDKETGEYWKEVKETLDQAPTQEEYRRLLEFENRDLQIRERKHACLSLFQQELSNHPALGGNAAYNPKEALTDFFDQKRDELDKTHLEWSPEQRDKEEIEFIDRVEQDIRERGPDSHYITEILGDNG